MLPLIGWIGCVILLVKGLELALRSDPSQRWAKPLGLATVALSLALAVWVYAIGDAMMASLRGTDEFPVQEEVVPMKGGRGGDADPPICTGPTRMECHIRADEDFRACISLSNPAVPATAHCRRVRDDSYESCKSEISCTP